MNAVTDFTELADPAPVAAPALPAPTDLKRVDLQAVALAHFGDWRSDVAAAKTILSTTVHDLSIPARIAEAKTLRQRMIGTPRAEVRKVSTGLKSKLTAVSKAVGAEADAAVAAYDALEPLITPQIEAAEQAIENARIAREKAEAERIHNLKLAVDGMLDPWLDRCNAADMTADRAASGIAALGQLAMPEQFADVAGYWAERVSVTSRQMESRRLALAAAELEAAQAKARAEQQRVAGIQARIAEIQAAATGHEKASSADIAEARAAVGALRIHSEIYGEFVPEAIKARDLSLAVLNILHAAAVRREEQAKAARVAQMIAEAAKLPRLPDERVAQIMRDLAQPLPLTIPEEPQPGAPTPVAQDGVAENPVQSQPGEFLTFASGDATAVRVAGDEDTGLSVDSPAPSVTPEPTMTLGMLNEFIAPLRIDAAGLESLGFPVAGRRKAAMLYHDTDRPAIVAALVKHLQGLA